MIGEKEKSNEDVWKEEKDFDDDLSNIKLTVTSSWAEMVDYQQNYVLIYFT